MSIIKAPIFNFLLITSIALSLGCTRKEAQTNDEGILNFDIAPNGESIVFSMIKNGKASLYKSNIDGTKTKSLLLNDSLSLYNPRFSPNGNQIVFIGASSDFKKSSLWIMKENGDSLQKVFEDKDLKIEAIFSVDDELVYFTQAMEYDHYSPIAMNAPHGFDIYSVNLKTKEIDRISKLNLFSLSDLTDLDQNRMMLTKNGGDDGIFFFDKNTMSLEKIETTNDTLRNSEMYANPILVDPEKIIASSSYQLVSINLKTKKEKLILSSTGSHFKIIRYNKKVNKLFFQKTDDGYYINSINLDGTALKRFKINM